MNATTKNEPAETSVSGATSSHLPAPERFEIGDKRRFHWRALNDRYEVYSIGLNQWAECGTPEHAETVADALESFYGDQPEHQPRLVRMLKNWKFVGKAGGAKFKCTIMAGEIGEYFAHSNTYLFRSRRGWVPYIPAKKLMDNPQAWECLPNDKIHP